MKKLLILVVFLPVILLYQESINAVDSPKKIKSIPIQAQYSDTFFIKNVTFNRMVDLFGKGEVLGVEFELVNRTDDPMDLYIFVIATFEKTEKTKSSFEIPVPEKERLRSFVPFPFNIENFQEKVLDSSGKEIVDSSGKVKIKYNKFPNDPKLGINPDTNQVYHLDNKIVVRTYHLSKYRTNYAFFNEVSILIFNKEESPLYKESFKLVGFRH